MDTYASLMKAILQRLLLVVASANKRSVLTGDISNAYLYADCDVKVYTRVGTEFGLAGYPQLPTGSLAGVVKALYGLPSSGRAWHLHLSGTLRSMGFKATTYDPDVYIRKNKEGTGYDYVGCHTDDITIVSNAAREIMNEIMDHYNIKKAG